MRTVLTMLAWVLPAVVAAETHTIAIEGMKFQPQTVTVKPGDTVVWPNGDVVPHTATSASQFDSGQIAPGSSWSWTAAGRGRLEYVCTYHPGMKAAVVVQ